MIAKRPSIYIYTYCPNLEMLQEICAGIEEEGIFYEIYPSDENEADILAYEAANNSMLGSGIGIKGTKTAFSFRGLKKGKNVECYKNPSMKQCRKMGSNSARAVKKMPLK